MDILSYQTKGSNKGIPSLFLNAYKMVMFKKYLAGSKETPHF